MIIGPYISGLHVGRCWPASEGGGDFAFSFFELTGDVDHDRDVDQTDLGMVSAALGTAGVRPQDGDANSDGSVNFADLVALAQNYHTPSGAAIVQGDFNGDGAVNFSDLVILAQNYNRSGRTDVDKSDLVDQDDVALVEANVDKTLPPPSGEPTAAAASFSEASRLVGLAPPTAPTHPPATNAKPVKKPAPSAKQPARTPRNDRGSAHVARATTSQAKFSTLSIRPSRLSSPFKTNRRTKCSSADTRGSHSTILPRIYSEAASQLVDSGFGGVLTS